MSAEMLDRVRRAWSMLRPGAVAARPFRCPICGPSLLLRLAPNGIAVRCLRCAASAVTLSLVSVLRAVRPGLDAMSVYELSTRGALVEFLGRTAAHLVTSEYLDDVPPGSARDGVLCQDVQQLTFPDASFDVCTSTEVFEHVADDARGFREIRRVLRAGGAFVFTVPLLGTEATVERAVLQGGQIVHLLPPEYHSDRIRGRESVLAFRTYGHDIVDRLRTAGFAQARIDWRCRKAFLGYGRGVVVAEI
jgi:SAM-dependent methyltransferase